MGTANRNIMVLPCMVKNWLYMSGPIDVRFGKRELQPHRAGEQTCRQEKAKCGHNVALADRGVMHGLEPAKKAGRLRPDPRKFCARAPVCCGRRLDSTSSRARWSLIAASPGRRAGLAGHRRHLIRRHAAAGLDALRVCDPAAEIADSVRQRAGCNGGAAGKMRQVRSDPRAGRSAANGMAHHAGVSEKDLLSVHGLRCRAARQQVASCARYQLSKSSRDSATM